MIDDVFDSAVEKKSPLILNHMSLGEAIADGGCVGGYYDCNGRGALEQVVTRDSYMNNDEEEEETEPRDPPPNPGPVSFGPDAPPMAHQDVVYDDVVPPNFTFAQQACAPLGKSAARGKKQQSKKMDAIVQSNHALAQQACAPLGKSAPLGKKPEREKAEKPEGEKPKDDVVVPPPKQTFAQRACATRGKTRIGERKEGEKNLLAKARGETASSSATTMLEASKQQTFENQPVPSSSQAKKKKANSNKPCPIEIPIYAKQTVGRKASPESSNKTDDVDAVRAEAAAKWRIAKAKQNKVHASISEDEEGEGDRYTPKMDPAPKHGNDAERDDVPQEDVVVVSDATPQVQESHKKESDEKETPPKTDYYDLAGRIAKTVAETPRQPPPTTQDPPDSFVDELEDDDVLSVFVESLKRSLNGQANGDAASLHSRDSTLPSNPSGGGGGGEDHPSSPNPRRQVDLQPPEEGTAMFFHKHAMALQHLEDQQTANRSKLFAQRLRHQRLKSHRTKQPPRAALPTVSLVSPSSSSLRSTNSRDPAGTVLGGEEETRSASTMVVQSFHVSLS